MKKKLRAAAIAERMGLTEEQIIAKSMAILAHLKTFEDALIGKKVFIFIDFKKEVQTQAIIEYLLTLSCEVFIPRIDMTHKEMEIHPYRSHAELIDSPYGIPEPPENPEAVISPEILDVVITPGVVFDNRGYRIGYGGGFYDRLFSKIGDKVLKIAVGFELQRTDRVPNDPYDMKIDHLITESGIYSYEK